MERARVALMAGALLAVVALLAAACGPAAEPTATTAPAQPTATTAPSQPTATTAAAQPTATTAVMEETKLRPIPVLGLPAPNPNAQYGGAYRHLRPESSSSFHGWESCCGAFGFVSGDTLTRFNVFEPNKGDQVVQGLAYDWWTDESGEVWTLKLRDDVTFHDGERFTCADAKFSLDTLRLGHDAKGSELASDPKGPLLARVTETRCTDDYTLEVVTDGPMPSLISTLALANFTIYPQHWLEGNLSRAQAEEPPGTGPFIFEENIPADHVSYVRNPNYWEQPYPYVDEYILPDLGSVTALHAAFRVGRGEYIAHNVLPKSQRQEMVAAGRLVEKPMVATHGLSALHTNWQRAPWSDLRFAQALRCATDSAKYIATSTDGEGFEGPIFPLATDPGGSPWALTLEEWMAVGPCHGPTALTDMEQRRQIARDLLAEMGFGPDNPARPDTVMWRPKMAEEFAPIMDDWAQVNVLPEIRVQPTAQAYATAYSGEFDIIGWGFSTSRVDPDHWLYEHYYSTADRNYGKYTNAEADALIDQQSRTLDQEARYALLKEISRILLRDNAKLLEAHRPYVQADPPWLKDFYPYTFATHYATNVWIDKAVFDRLGG